MVSKIAESILYGSTVDLGSKSSLKNVASFKKVDEATRIFFKMGELSHPNYPPFEDSSLLALELCSKSDNHFIVIPDQAALSRCVLDLKGKFESNSPIEWWIVTIPSLGCTLLENVLPQQRKIIDSQHAENLFSPNPKILNLGDWTFNEDRVRRIQPAEMVKWFGKDYANGILCSYPRFSAPNIFLGYGIVNDTNPCLIHVMYNDEHLKDLMLQIRENNNRRQIAFFEVRMPFEHKCEFISGPKDPLSSSWMQFDLDL